MKVTYICRGAKTKVLTRYVLFFKQLICYLFLKAKAKGGAKGGGRRAALLEEVGVEVGAFAEPLHEFGGPAGGTWDANEVQVVFHCLLPLTEVEGAEVDSGIEDVKDSTVFGKPRCRLRGHLGCAEVELGGA